MATTITTSGTLTYDGSAFYYTPTGGTSSTVTFPITITSSSGSLTVTFGSNLTLTGVNDYFIIGGAGVTIDGANFEVTVPTNYNGLVQNGSSSAGSGLSNCLVKNIPCKESS